MDYLCGKILIGKILIEGYVAMEDGIIAEISEEKCPDIPLASGIIIPMIVNTHTHCADGAIKTTPGMSLEDLVAPPNGLKHRYLNNATDDEIKTSIKDFSNKSYKCGSGTFIDFREGGLKGCLLLKETVPEAIILGRPISPEYNENEVDAILDIADGIGLPSISDMNHKYIEKIADRVRERQKIFAIHASERIREDIDEILSLDPTFVVHMTEASDSDLLKCAETDVGIVVCTRSNMFFGKIPPIGRMERCGIEISIGTDNAMLCTPDMRAETKAFMDVAIKQGRDPDNIWGPMVINGRKIIYNHNTLDLKIGRKAELAVMPCDGPLSVCRMLSCNDPIFAYKNQTVRHK
jgi:cytosine/adenosine deaminase-related metal-dependent hydrolase